MVTVSIRGMLAVRALPSGSGRSGVVGRVRKCGAVRDICYAPCSKSKHHKDSFLYFSLLSSANRRERSSIQEEKEVKRLSDKSRIS